MDFSWTPEQQAFRQELRVFLNAELTPEMRRLGAEDGASQEFSRRMGRRGLIGLPWPKEYGGRGLGHLERLIYSEEMLLSGAPIGYHHNAERQMGPSIIMVGTEEQKREFLPRIARGELSIAIGYSEPDTGSDLAGLKTRAVRDGDDYVVDGAKVWNAAHRSDYIWLAARTDPDAPKHRGISVFMVDLKTPGTTISPIQNMAGIPGFCLVTFEGARVPKSALIGEENRGWYVVAANLDFERSGIERVAQGYSLWQDFLAFVKQASFNGHRLADDPRVRNTLAQTQIEFEVGRLLCYKVAYEMSQGRVPNIEATASKLFGCEATQRRARTMSQVLGLYGQLEPGSPHAPLAGRVERAWVYAITWTIAGGTSEIMRNIIATRGLGLPRP
jgi:alkylation response protein AidB-like acyl-CoA dehydrogenase